MRVRPLFACLLALGAILSCSHRVEFDRSAAGDIHRLAVVVRVLHDPTVELEDHLPAGQTADKLIKALTSTMTTFELAERLRSSLLEHLPSSPPFSDLAPIVQVEAALGSLLTVEKNAGPPSFKDLKPLGVDGVLYLEVEHWGASVEDEKPALFFDGTARMFTLDGDSTVWREPIQDRGPSGGLSGDWSQEANLRALLTDLSENAGTRLAVSLGGSSNAHGGPSALDNPDVKVDSTPAPEKQKTVLPFVDEVDAGSGAVDAGSHGKSKAGPVDAGDPLFPG